jgi:hypothetical protein
MNAVPGSIVTAVNSLRMQGTSRRPDLWATRHRYQGLMAPARGRNKESPRGREFGRGGSYVKVNGQA